MITCTLKYMNDRQWVYSFENLGYIMPFNPPSRKHWLHFLEAEANISMTNILKTKTCFRGKVSVYVLYTI